MTFRRSSLVKLRSDCGDDMNLRFLLISAIILFAAALFCVGGLGEIEWATADQCGGSSYLCEKPQVAGSRHVLNYAALMRAEHRFGLI
jgi:hypothetical protein